MSQAETVTAIEALDASGQGVRVEFQKVGDRFVHTIFSVSPTVTQPLLKSIEGTSDETAPASPPFAELHKQDDIIFLSGATTLGHWSMSVQAEADRLLFDVACRIKALLPQLGSSYEQLSLTPTIDSENATVTQPTGNSLQLTPQTTSAQSYPTTVQWRYSISKNS